MPDGIGSLLTVFVQGTERMSASELTNDGWSDGRLVDGGDNVPAGFVTYEQLRIIGPPGVCVRRNS